ncbi:MFS transporter [Ascidiaceihabitans sp.]|mgnify:CR=1 FL=1|nr:MFS transporter [Ascidiaceihabitans sp.]
MGILDDLYLSRKALAGFTVIGMAWATYFAQMPVIKASLDVSDATYGLVVLVSSLGAVWAMFLAPLAQRLAGPFALVFAAIGIAAGFMWVGVALNAISLMLALAIASAGSGILDVLVNARIAGIEAQHKRSLMNLNHAAYSFCYAGGALLTGLAREASWTPIQVFSVLAVVIVAWCFVMYGPDIDQDADAEVASSANLPVGLIWVIGAIVFIAFLAESSTEGWSALHIERTLGGGAGEGALGPAFLGLTMGIGRLSGYALTRYFSDLVLIALACLLSAIGIAIAAGASTVLMAYVGFAFGGLGISIVAPTALALIGRAVPGKLRTIAISRATVIGYCAFFMGPSLMGFVSEWFSLAISFFTIAVLLVVVAAILIPMLSVKLRNPA